MHLPFQKVKKIVWGKYRDWDNRDFFLLYGQLTLFYKFIFCKKEVVATRLMWNDAKFMAV